MNADAEERRQRRQEAIRKATVAREQVFKSKEETPVSAEVSPEDLAELGLGPAPQVAPVLAEGDVFSADPRGVFPEPGSIAASVLAAPKVLAKDWKLITDGQRDGRIYTLSAHPDGRDSVQAFWRRTRAFLHSRWTYKGGWAEAKLHTPLLFEPAYYRTTP